MVVQECPGIVGDPSESVVPDVVRFVNNIAPSGTGNVYLPLRDIPGIDDNVAYTEKTREMGTQHVAGEFVFVESDNQLYEITSTINSGGTLTPGTNATACSIGDVLRQLNSDIATQLGSNLVQSNLMYERILSGDINTYNYAEGISVQYVGSGVTNAASGDPHMMFTIYHGAGFIAQFVFVGARTHIFARIYSSGTWGSWLQLNN